MESKGRFLLEENPQAIADIARKSGATEGEARALLLLERLGEVFDGLPNVITGEQVQFAVHHQALVNMVAVRVVARAHPGAWGRADNPEDRG